MIDESLTPSPRVQKAYDFGLKAHEGQMRKYTGKPYFTDHCLPVALHVQSRGGTEDMVIAALLHDTIEDTDVTYEELETEFGPDVAGLVWELTDAYTKEAYPEWNREKRKRCEAWRLASVSEEAKEIKLCDLINNTTSIVEHDPNFAVVYLREKSELLAEMFGGKK